MRTVPGVIGASMKKVVKSNKFLLLLLVAVFAVGFAALGMSGQAKADIEAERSNSAPSMVLAQGAADTGTAGTNCSLNSDSSEALHNNIRCEGERSAASPAQYATWAKSDTSMFDSMDYLAFKRWYGVNAMPIEENGLSSLSQMGSMVSSQFGSMIFSVAQTVFLLLGLVLTAAMSIDLLSRVVYTVDWIFGSIGSTILGLDSPSSMLMVIAGLVFASALVAFVLPKSRYGGGNPLGQIIFSLAVITGIGLMTVQATKNHSGSDIPEIGATKDGYSLYEGDSGGNDAWEVFSPGWLISRAAVLANTVSGAVVSVTQSISGAVESGNTAGYNNDCNRYITGMHYVYSNTPGAKGSGGKSNVVVAYDNMVRKLYYQNFQSATWGDSAGVDSAWCRMAESASGKPVGDQIMIARVAGLYGEAVGLGGFGMVDDNPSMVANPNAMNISGRSGGISVAAGNSAIDQSKALVDQAGNWQPMGDGGSPEKTRQAATRFFGPSFNVEENDDKVSPPRGGKFAAIYFAACQWPVPGGSVAMNPEYDGKVYEGSNGEFTNATEGDEPEKALLDPGRCLGAGDTKVWEGGFADGSDASNMWNYYDHMKGEVRIPGISDATGMSIKWGSQAAATQFMASPPALSYYQHVFGVASGSALVLSIIAMVLSVMVLKYFGPMVLGAVMSQFLATLALIIAPMSALFLVFPTAKSRQMFAVLVKTIISALLVAGMITALMSLIFAVVSIFVAVLENQTSSAFINSLMIGFATLMGFAASMKMVEMITGVDPKSMESAFKAGASAASPALNELGYKVPSPLTNEFWRGKKSEHYGDGLKLDKESSIAKGAAGAKDDVKNLFSRASGPAKKNAADAKEAAAAKVDKTADEGRQSKLAAVMSRFGVKTSDKITTDKEEKGAKIADSGFTPDLEDVSALDRAGAKVDSETKDPASPTSRHMGLGASDQYVGDNSKSVREEIQNNFSADAQEEINKAAFAGGASAHPGVNPAITEGQGLEQFQSPHTEYPGAATTAPTERTAMAAQAMSDSDTASMAATAITGADLIAGRGLDLTSMDLSQLSSAVSDKVNEAASEYVKAYTEQLSNSIGSSSLSADLATPSSKIAEMRSNLQSSLSSTMSKVGDRMDSTMSESINKSIEDRGKHIEDSIGTAARNLSSASTSTSNRVVSEISESFRRSDRNLTNEVARSQSERAQKVVKSLEAQHEDAFSEIISQYNNMGRRK